MNTLEGLIETILPGGDGLIRHEQGTYLIPLTAPGDQISFTPSEKRRGAMRGTLNEVISPSSSRVPAVCPVAESCGGCALQFVSCDAQAEIKSDWVKQAFHEVITKETRFTPVATNHNPFAGRRRVRWFAQNGQLGFHQRLSHNVIESPRCNAVTESLDSLRTTLQTFLPEFPSALQSIQAVEMSNGTHVILESEAETPEKVKLPELPNIQWWWRRINTPSIKPLHKPTHPLYDSIVLNNGEQGKSLDIQIGPNDFVQGHQAGNQLLIDHILHWSKGSKRVVDLFSGVGNLSLPIAAAYQAEVIGAEVNKSSVKAANENAKRLKLNAKYSAMDLFGSFSLEDFIGADTLIIDPPRKGAKRICQNIHTLFPKQIIMVNCDAAAGARDAEALASAGFKLKELVALDLFPFTGHVEAVSLWQP